MKREDATNEDYQQKHHKPNIKGSEALLAKLISIHGEEYAPPAPVVEEVLTFEALPVQAISVWPVIPEVVTTEEEPQGPITPTVKEIKKHVAQSFGVRLLDLDSPRRQADLVRARQVAMYLCRTLTTRSFVDIGSRFGGRDHTTVLHAVHKISGMVLTDRVFAAQIDELAARFQ